MVVAGSGLGRRCLLRVRERRVPEPVDTAARESAASEHVVGVVRRLGERRVRGREWDAVLLQYPERGDLERLLGGGGGLRGGEAATVLLGVAGGVAALHRAGWARPGLSPSAVVFAADGCPALDDLDAVVPYHPEAAVADAEAFYGFARALCLRVVDGTGMSLLGAVERGLRHGTWAQVEASVLAAVAPEPVSVQERGCDETGVTPAGAPAVRRRWGVRTAVASAMEFLDGDPVSVLRGRLGAWLRRRPAVVVAGLVPLVAAVAIVALLPAPPAESAAVRTASTPSSAPPNAVSAAPTASTTRSSGDSTATPTATPPAPEGMAANDPVVAAAAVLEARHACFAQRPGSAGCLEAVLDAEQTFAAQEADALDRSGAAEERDFSGASLSLIERWGDAALIAAAPDRARTPKSEPASLLLVRNEAGWRLRAVYP